MLVAFDHYGQDVKCCPLISTSSTLKKDVILNRLKRH
jgi:hypothetical protein